LSNLWFFGGRANGNNADGDAGWSNIRFRHGGNQVANMLFVDGHVAGIQYGEMTIGATRVGR
jgi:prepilin-type processing-associated H-X9-DG protein